MSEQKGALQISIGSFKRYRMKASDLLIKALENEGVEYIFGIPGEENLDMLESLRTSSIKLIVARHEQAAGFMAATYGRLTGKPGVAMSTLGPGATNLLTSVAYAQLGAMPVVFITGQKPLENRKQAAFQVIDVVNMMRPVCKMSEQVSVASSIAFKVREAFRTAQHETPGATHLEFPEDTLREEVEDLVIEPRNHRDIGLAAENDIEAVAETIRKARRPLIMLAANAKRAETCEVISKWVERCGIPFVSTQMGKGIVSEFSPYNLGTAAISEGEIVHEALDKADLIINIGHDIVEKPPFDTSSNETTVIHLNYHPANIVEVYRPSIELIGDISHSVKRLSEELADCNWDFNDFEAIRERQNREIWQNIPETGFPVKPQELVDTVQRTMNEDGMITLDNGMYKVWFARQYRSSHPKGILLDNALASMGAGLPSAIGAQIVHPERQVLSICGDGGFMMNSAEMETAVRLGLNLTVLIVNDEALGMIRWKQEGMGFDNYGLDLGNPDFVQYAESYGAKGYRVNEAGELEGILRECLQSKGVQLIEVPVDYTENKKVFG